MKTGGFIYKIYHVDPNDPIFNKDFYDKIDKAVSERDLTSFVKYSLNKKQRWETDGSLKTLKALKDTYRNMDVVVNNRVWLDSNPFLYFLSHINDFHYFFDNFPISKSVQLDTEIEYRCLSSGSVFGQSLKSLLPENRHHEKKKHDNVNLKTAAFENPKVAYHILTPPKNYEKLRNKDFHPASSDRYLKHKSIHHWRRCKIMTEALHDIRYEDPKYLDDQVFFDENYFDQDFGTPRLFYNLMDHFVNDFVIVKRRKRQNFSVVSDN